MTQDPATNGVVYVPTVWETTKGSEGMSGAFEIDFEAPFGARSVAPQRVRQAVRAQARGDADRGRRRRGAAALPLGRVGRLGRRRRRPRGRRGGLEWRVKFTKNPGAYRGFTFPPGAGNLDSITVDGHGLQGNVPQVVNTVLRSGSTPFAGAFALGVRGAWSEPMEWQEAHDEMEYVLEQMDTVGELRVARSDVALQRVEGVWATVDRDGATASLRYDGTFGAGGTLETVLADALNPGGSSDSAATGAASRRGRGRRRRHAAGQPAGLQGGLAGRGHAPGVAGADGAHGRVRPRRRRDARGDPLRRRGAAPLRGRGRDAGPRQRVAGPLPAAHDVLGLGADDGLPQVRRVGGGRRGGAERLRRAERRRRGVAVGPRRARRRVPLLDLLRDGLLGRRRRRRAAARAHLVDVQPPLARGLQAGPQGLGQQAAARVELHGPRHRRPDGRPGRRDRAAGDRAGPGRGRAVRRVLPPEVRPLHDALPRLGRRRRRGRGRAERAAVADGPQARRHGGPAAHQPGRRRPAQPLRGHAPLRLERVALLAPRRVRRPRRPAAALRRQGLPRGPRPGERHGRRLHRRRGPVPGPGPPPDRGHLRQGPLLGRRRRALQGRARGVRAQVGAGRRDAGPDGGPGRRRRRLLRGRQHRGPLQAPRHARGRVPGDGVHRLRRVGGGRRGGVRRAGLRLQQRRRGQRRGPRRRGARGRRRGAVRPRLRLRLHLPRPGQHARGLGLRRRHVQRPRRERAADRGRGRRLRGGLPGRGGPGAAPGGDGHDGAQLDDGRALRGRREVPRARRPRPHRRVGRRVPPLHGRGDGDARHGRPARAGAGRGLRRDRRRHPAVRRLRRREEALEVAGRRAGVRRQDRHAGPRRLRLRGGLRRPAPRERGPAGDRRRGVGPVRGLVGPRRRPRARRARHHDARGRLAVRAAAHAGGRGRDGQARDGPLLLALPQPPHARHGEHGRRAAELLRRLLLRVGRPGGGARGAHPGRAEHDLPQPHGGAPADHRGAQRLRRREHGLGLHLRAGLRGRPHVRRPARGLRRAQRHDPAGEDGLLQRPGQRRGPRRRRVRGLRLEPRAGGGDLPAGDHGPGGLRRERHAAEERHLRLQPHGRGRGPEDVRGAAGPDGLGAHRALGAAAPAARGLRRGRRLLPLPQRRRPRRRRHRGSSSSTRAATRSSPARPWSGP